MLTFFLIICFISCATVRFVSIVVWFFASAMGILSLVLCTVFISCTADTFNLVSTRLLSVNVSVQFPCSSIKPSLHSGICLGLLSDTIFVRFGLSDVVFGLRRMSSEPFSEVSFIVVFFATTFESFTTVVSDLLALGCVPTKLWTGLLSIAMCSLEEFASFVWSTSVLMPLVIFTVGLVPSAVDIDLVVVAMIESFIVVVAAGAGFFVGIGLKGETLE